MLSVGGGNPDDEDPPPKPDETITLTSETTDCGGYLSLLAGASVPHM
jgi:hypothetical protein